jgi:diadenosine tetraphosphatase ApaH/serine/threonine PP2A family protein phosphatase
VVDPLTAMLSMDAQSRRVSCVGHSHVALSFHRDSNGDVSGIRRAHGELAAVDGGAWLLNPGSVGQPRDGDPRAAWMLLDTSLWTVSWRRVQYDVVSAQRAIRRAGLPRALAERLGYGK